MTTTATTQLNSGVLLTATSLILVDGFCSDLLSAENRFKADSPDASSPMFQ